MTNHKFSIGETVWRASWQSVEKRVTCPDCGGTRVVTIELFDGTRHMIACEGCQSGWMGALGYLTLHDREALVTEGVVTGVQIKRDGVEYNVDPGYICDAENAFATREEALARAAVLAAEAKAEEEKRVLGKEKPLKTWAWHVTYYRRQIRDAQDRINYATKQLNMASAKAKEPSQAECSERGSG